MILPMPGAMRHVTHVGGSACRCRGDGSFHEKYFLWENRQPALMRVIDSWDADLISLVECDHYNEFFKPEMERRGYHTVRCGATATGRPAAGTAAGLRPARD